MQPTTVAVVPSTLTLDAMSKSDGQIAILDDDASVRKALVRLFEASRRQVKTYESAKDFLTSIDQDKPKCLVVDLQMPGMTGLELLTHLQDAGIRIPTIVITAHDEMGTRERCIAAGALVYFLKPVRRSLLLDAVDKVMRGCSKS